MSLRPLYFQGAVIPAAILRKIPDVLPVVRLATPDPAPNAAEYSFLPPGWRPRTRMFHHRALPEVVPVGMPQDRRPRKSPIPPRRNKGRRAVPAIGQTGRSQGGTRHPASNDGIRNPAPDNDLCSMPRDTRGCGIPVRPR
ncbi:hypothetical protein SDC9_196986 [bioreactor metagenome]|uniref:Uncharacterized protein n=1 Tax=bioreactor metagenome TaxID=1076179 RepID=A0A645IEK2_9ZZZZ